VFSRHHKSSLSFSSSSQNKKKEEKEEEKNSTRTNTSRFIPWNQEHFHYIGNGQTESDYLDFLEEGIFRRTSTATDDSNDDDYSSYALRKFVESLKVSSKSNDNNDVGVGDDDDYLRQQIEEKHVDNDKEDENEKEIVGVRNNETVLEWEKRPNKVIKERLKLNKTARIEQYAPPGTRTRKQIKKQLVSYRLTTFSDTKYIRTLASPLGPLIEYIAYKTEAQPERILKHVIELDKEMSLKDKSSQTYIDMVRVTPQLVYNCVMGKPSGFNDFKDATITPFSSKKKIQSTKTNNNSVLTASPQQQTIIDLKANTKENHDISRQQSSSNSSSIFHTDPILRQYNFNEVETEHLDRLRHQADQEQMQMYLSESEDNDMDLSVGQTDWI